MTRIALPLRSTAMRLLVAGLLSSLATTAAHAATSASLSFSDLRFTLIDLTPDDGIGPSATFNQAGTTISVFTNLDPAGGNGDSAALTGLPLPTLSINDIRNTVSIGGTGGSLSSALLSSSDVVSSSDSEIFFAHGMADAVAVMGYEPALDTPGMDGYQFIITLGANTGISFDASYATSLRLSQQQLVDMRDAVLAQVSPGSTVTATFFSTDVAAGLQAAFYVGSANDPNFVHMSGSDSLNAGEYDFCDTCALTDLVSETSGTLSGSYVNTTGSNLDVSFLLMGQTRSWQSASVMVFPTDPLPDPEIPPIPEPGTYALMGLGLVGLWGATRAHRRRATA